MPKKKFYVVWKGKNPGVYESWDECKKQIENFTGALYKSFESETNAIRAFASKPSLYIGKTNSKPSKTSKKPLMNTISVDAACSGNPGALEYQGVETATKKLLFHLGPFPEGTVNLGEFLALVHGLAFLKKRKLDIPIYSDSVTAMKWVKDKKIKTNLERNKRTEELFEYVDRALLWLINNEYKNPILKWETSSWGEIPADFGRK
jgi:ribonuclease HI